MTRRTLIGGALATAVAAPLLRAATPSGTARAPRVTRGSLARGVALGPGGVGVEQRYGSNRRYFGETGCAWVRLWAEWPKLQPRPDAPPDFTDLEREIAAARADGLNVMVTAWRYPRWSNGTEVLTPEQDFTFELADRVTPGENPAGRKDLTFKLPADLGDASPFAHWIEAVARLDIDALEIVNEPNHQIWPQRDIATSVARMIATARVALDRAGDSAPLLVAPSTADRRGTSLLGTDHVEFATGVLDQLDAIGFRPDARVAWSHHNYGDVESDSSERIAAAGAIVAARWPGIPILVTESGVRLDAISLDENVMDPMFARRRQADLIARGYERLRVGVEGAHVGLVMQYLFITDWNYDSGLCELDGQPRPAYQAWAELPTVS